MAIPAAPRGLQRIAYHEAGHAVAAYLLRRRFDWISIQSDEHFLGYVTFTAIESLGANGRGGRRARALAEREIMIDLAGNIAERIFTGRHDWMRATVDIRNINEVALRFCADAEEAQAFIRWLTIRTRNLLSRTRNWAAVSALADALLHEGKLSYPAARPIIARAIRSWRNKRRRA